MERTSEPTYDDIIARAERIGTEHGRASATWVTDGNTTEQQYRHLLSGLTDGDPEVLDSLPSPDLSGQWADGFSSRDLAEHLRIEEDADCFDDACTAYETSFSDALSDAVEKTCRYHLEDPRVTGTTRSAARMTRCHFQFIADACRDAGLSEAQVGIFANALAATNTKFNRSRFIDAATEAGA